MASWTCKNNPDSFCYVCGYYIGQKIISYTIEKRSKYWIAYKLYFGMQTGDKDKSWAPDIICESCHLDLEVWLKGNLLIFKITQML